MYVHIYNISLICIRIVSVIKSKHKMEYACKLGSMFLHQFKQNYLGGVFRLYLIPVHFSTLWSTRKQVIMVNSSFQGTTPPNVAIINHMTSSWKFTPLPACSMFLMQDATMSTINQSSLLAYVRRLDEIWKAVISEYLAPHLLNFVHFTTLC
jgi:hypothetical protein